MSIELQKKENMMLQKENEMRHELTALTAKADFMASKVPCSDMSAYSSVTLSFLS